jgi:hypothetical protein
MRKLLIICDRCGAEKGESNHWISYTRPGFRAARIFSFDEREKYLDLPIGHLCGRECAHKLLDEVLGEGDANKTG